MLEDITITNFTVDGKCANCGACCSNCLPLSEKEIMRIHSYIKKHNIKEQRHNFMNGIDMTCPFRDNINRKCLIYEIRPAICREFMCNHTREDIMQSKLNIHLQNRVVFMRTEFFGNREDVNFYADVMRMMIEGG